jgi:hypothetical protein
VTKTRSFPSGDGRSGVILRTAFWLIASPEGEDLALAVIPRSGIGEEESGFALAE